MTSTGICCPGGQTPSGPNKSQCVPLIPIHLPPLAASDATEQHLPFIWMFGLWQLGTQLPDVASRS
jgi:hypothetical protein